MNLKIKKLDEAAVIPQRMSAGAAAMDLTATSMNYDENNHCWVYGTGLAMEIPRNHVGILSSRSSVYKTGMVLNNAIGVIDSDFRGEVKLIFKGVGLHNPYKVGDRIGQIMILELPSVNIQIVDQLSNTERGEGGFGSTNK